MFLEHRVATVELLARAYAAGNRGSGASHVAHEVRLTVPKRLRPYLLYDHRRLGRLSRVAYRTLCHHLRAALGEPEAVPGAIVWVCQGSSNFPHLRSPKFPHPG